MDENREFFLTESEKAANTIRDTISHIETIDKRLIARTNNQDRSGLTRQILFSAGWLLFYVVFGMITLLSGYRGIIILINIIGILSGTWIALILFLNNMNTAKFYWDYLDYRTELGEIKEKLNASIQNLSEERSLLMSGEETGWDRKLEIHKPVPLTLREIEKKISGIPGFNSDILRQSNSLLFYIAACFGTCCFGYQLLMRLVVPHTGFFGFNAGFVRGVGIFALLVVSIAEIFVVRWFLSRTEGEINNFSMLAVPTGIVCSLLLAGIILMILSIGRAVLRWIGILLAVAFFCAVIVFGFSAGNR